MNSEIKIVHELRPCVVSVSGIVTKALFHQWTEEGNAILELENGECSTYAPWQIKFVDERIKDYCFRE